MQEQCDDVKVWLLESGFRLPAEFPMEMPHEAFMGHHTVVL